MKKRKLKVYWIYLLVLGFAYERPVYFLTSMDRANPRIYDLLMLVGVFLFWKDLFKRSVLPPAIRPWKYLVYWFTFCALIWGVLLVPLEFGAFSLFYASRYLLGIVTIYFVARAKLYDYEKRNVLYCIAAGGIFVASFAVYQFLNPKLEIVIADGKVFTPFENIITGPFGATYFHIAQYSTVCFMVVIIYTLFRKGIVQKILWLLISVFIAWPLLFSGSRTGLAYLGLSLMVVLLIEFKKTVLLLFPIIIIALVVALNNRSTIQNIVDNSATFSRLIGGKSASKTSEVNSVENRLNHWKINFSDYKYGGYTVPFIGAGFYIAPVNGSYRIGYGLHNNYTFMIEQGGIVALILFLVFMFRCIWEAYKRRKSSISIDRIFAKAAFVYLFCTILLNIAGQIFVRGYNTNNLNAFILTILVLGVSTSLSSKVAHE